MLVILRMMIAIGGLFLSPALAAACTTNDGSPCASRAVPFEPGFARPAPLPSKPAQPPSQRLGRTIALPALQSDLELRPRLRGLGVGLVHKF